MESKETNQEKRNQSSFQKKRISYIQRNLFIKEIANDLQTNTAIVTASTNHQKV